jgi:5-methylcytosine-specific restriction endonuclease McrA
MSKQPWDKWYGHSSWRRRRRLQLQQYPLCAICLAQGRSVTATVVDHVTPHKGDWNSFKLGRLQSLCASCHNSVKQNVERHGFDRTIGADGMPIDKNHPCYRGTTRKPETEPPPPLDLKTLIS